MGVGLGLTVALLVTGLLRIGLRLAIALLVTGLLRIGLRLTVALLVTGLLRIGLRLTVALLITGLLRIGLRLAIALLITGLLCIGLRLSVALLISRLLDRRLINGLLCRCGGLLSDLRWLDILRQGLGGGLRKRPFSLCFVFHFFVLRFIDCYSRITGATNQKTLLCVRSNRHPKYVPLLDSTLQEKLTLTITSGTMMEAVRDIGLNF